MTSKHHVFVSPLWDFGILLGLTTGLAPWAKLVRPFGTAWVGLFYWVCPYYLSCVANGRFGNL